MSFKESFGLEDDIYAEVNCDKCGNTRALYLCDNLNDFYIYADNFLDKRYFNYNR